MRFHEILIQRKILHLEHKIEKEWVVTLQWCEYSTNTLGWIGTLLSRADHLRRVSISVKYEGDEEIGLVSRGPYHQHSRKTFSHHGFDTRELLAGWMGCIAEYLKTSTSLQHLKITNYIFFRDDLQLLASALMGFMPRDLVFREIETEEGDLSTFLTLWIQQI